MALTVNTKPSGFQPVGGGSLLYQWTESDLTGKTNYRVVVQFNGYTSVLPNFEFRPDASGVIVADLAPILRRLLVLSEVAATRIINTYVEYTGVWDESNYSEVALSGDVIYAYVGNNHYINYRSHLDIRSSDGNASKELATGVFLMYPGKYTNERTYEISFLCDGTLPNNSRFFFRIDEVNWAAADIFDGSVKGMYQFDIALTAMGDVDESDLEIFVTNNGISLYYAYMKAKIYSECENSVHLRWINDYGGLQYWVFDYNQIFGFQIGNNEKYKEIECVSNGITLEEWYMLNELNRSGVVYNDNYKQGQFVEDVTDEDDPIPLVVQPRELSTQTKRASHDFRVNLRYPLIPNTDV